MQSNRINGLRTKIEANIQTDKRTDGLIDLIHERSAKAQGTQVA